MTYVYKFVRLPVRIGAKLSKHPGHPSYQDVISDYAKQGWRFVQLIVESPASIPDEYVLVFERPSERPEHIAQ